MNGMLAARADFGFGNPNMAGAFFAMLAVGVWGAWMVRRGRVSPPWRFWFCLGASAVCTALMIATASRGAGAALMAGVLAAWGAAGFPRPRLRQAGGLLAVMLALGALAASGRMGERVATSSGDDRSITSRVEIFKAVPAMLAAAPHGWGPGHSAEAYQHWFQAADDARTYKHLLSTHATWIVERGWGFRVFYLLAWSGVLLLCANTPAILGVWVVFGVAGIFSHVGGDWRLTILPVLALAGALRVRIRHREWPSVRAWGVGVATAGVIALGLAGVGAATNPKILRTDDAVRVGSKNPPLWFFSPDIAVLGRTYGKVIRARQPAGAGWSISACGGAETSKVVLSGDAPIRAKDAAHAPGVVLWLNPPARLSTPQEQFLQSAREKTIVWGGMRTDARPGELRAWFERLPGARWKNIPGRGLYLGGEF